jgi:hypothetical protein
VGHLLTICLRIHLLRCHILFLLRGRPWFDAAGPPAGQVTGRLAGLFRKQSALVARAPTLCPIRRLPGSASPGAGRARRPGTSNGVALCLGLWYNLPKEGYAMTSALGRGRPRRGWSPPDEPGRYAFRSVVDGVLLYVGQTDRLRTRLRQHQRAGRFAGCLFEYQVAPPGCAKHDLCASERARIEKHRPPLNLNGGGGGRRPAGR